MSIAFNHWFRAGCIARWPIAQHSLMPVWREVLTQEAKWVPVFRNKTCVQMWSNAIQIGNKFRGFIYLGIPKAFFFAFFQKRRLFWKKAKSIIFGWIATLATFTCHVMSRNSKSGVCIAWAACLVQRSVFGTWTGRCHPRISVHASFDTWHVMHMGI